MNIICAIKQQEKLKVKMQFPLFHHTFVTYTGLWLLVSLFVVWQPAKAETITIGKGSGIVWEGMPFNVTLDGPLKAPSSQPFYGILSISTLSTSCTSKDTLRTIAGYKAFPLALGVGLVPRAMGTANYVHYSGTPVAVSATIGLPLTQGIGENSHLKSPPEREWCIPSNMSFQSQQYSPTSPRTANISGTWVIVTDGTQKTAEVNLSAMYAASFSSSGTGDLYTRILPANIKLRISNLECTVNTPTQINFGPVAHDPTPGAELGSLSYPLTTQCSQDSNRINANINLQFRAISGLYQNSPSKLSLATGGGYITGEIDNGVTGSGSCAVASGIPFDNKPIRVGSITSTQSSLSLANQVTWRLCSGGPSLPLGNVDAAAEMLVTFN